MITEIINKLLDFSKIRIKFSEEDETTAKLCEALTDNGTVIRKYRADGVGKCEVKTVCDGENMIFYADMSVFPNFYRYRGASFSISFDETDKVLSFYHHNPWDMICSFPESSKELIRMTQGILAEMQGHHVCLLPLCGENFRCEADDGELFINSHYESEEYKGAFLSVSVSDRPYEAFRLAYEFAHKSGALLTPLKEEKTFPKPFEGIGFCTWNAFYKKVTSADIYKKLDEFREKGVKISWLLIDDGWLNENGEALLTFEANPEKFPEGLKKCIERIKTEYGIKYVGLWHTFQGHWKGIDKNGDVFRDYGDCYMDTIREGCNAPCSDEERAYRFWDAFHSFLASCGVDFVKTDNQSSLNDYITGIMPSTEYARISHRALERSTLKNFDNALLNCMGMDIEEMQLRPFSALTRNSDDFFPDREDGFAKHLVQNVYNTIMYSPLYYCDFDMFWSGKSDPVRSGVLRAISGATIYMSDALGETNPDNIVPICGKNYEYDRFDGAAMPTLDRVYENCLESGKFVKAFNYKDGDCALAVFNITNEEKGEEISLSDIPTLEYDTDYIAFEYFSKSFMKISKEDTLYKVLSAEGVASYTFVPVKSDGDGEYVIIGDTDMYFPSMSREKKKVYVKDMSI